jgi:hypothetical protein
MSFCSYSGFSDCNSIGKFDTLNWIIMRFPVRFEDKTDEMFGKISTLGVFEKE